jgi:hypothetical protein
MYADSMTLGYSLFPHSTERERAWAWGAIAQRIALRAGGLRFANPPYERS